LSNNFTLRDWNDARLLITCAECGSFAAAAAALGQDQTTVSRRIADLEAAIGRPLFHRRRSGASPTVAGMALLVRAQDMARGASEIESAIRGLARLPAPVVTIAATEGLLEFTIKPALIGDSRKELPLDWRSVPQSLPELAFSTDPRGADIVVEATNPGELPKGTGSVRVRSAGKMHFVPVAAREFLNHNSVPTRFDDIAHSPVVDIGLYHAVRGLDDWNDIVNEADPELVTVVANTPDAQIPVLERGGITVLPPYAALYERRLAVLEMAAPEMSVSLWIRAHEDTLREPAARTVYDLLARMFQHSPWFR
jgi:DNA-binding transcriptional LysR family regulator